ncbi:adenylosuccinate lyase [Candidatus Hydrogenisulfobacillus filiaventi]|uniref:Adenylosuccinate lyase n=1 Tax=Candidatus Hydrogenisulfobacillus filiaventi TaxID=2707344 RepID=A0A6F8ZHY3_9FIRM|nr:adenylosuccinate lyase [Bacillota bacterium]CAB1129262.1 adenylosuccinate lyase [Candidatus Hydrogenisulfobacillus filiaventi]
MIPRYQRPRMAALWSDQHRYDRWLEIERWAVAAWEALGVIPAGVADRLAAARVDPARVEAYEARFHHDVIAFLAAAGETVDPEDAKYLHYGLTSSDVVDTALASLTVEALEVVEEGLAGLRQAVRERALAYKDLPVVGRTHGMHAEPTSFGLKFVLWWLELGRDADRLARAKEGMRVMKLSGAVGNFANVPPEVEAFVAERLGLRPAPVATQVLQRDRHAEVLTALAILGGTLDKMATEIRHLQRSEVGEAEEPFAAGQRGSSAMPHKRNPVKSEQVSGLARLLRGYVVPALEDMALWHERDISHSSVERVILPDATTLADYLLDLMTRIIRGLTVKPEAMRRNLERGGGLVFSERVLLKLVGAGMTREEAYQVVQAAAMGAIAAGEAGPDFRQRLEADPRVQAVLGPAGLADAFRVEPYLRYVEELYRRSGILEEDGTGPAAGAPGGKDGGR